MRLLSRAAILAVATAVFAAPASAEQFTLAQIVQRHVSSGGDVDRIMEDYADDAVVFQQGRAVQGKAAIRTLFERMFPPRPAGSGAPRPATPNPNPPRIWEEGDVGFMVGQLGPMTLTEQYLVRDGKIVLQAIWMGPPPAPAPVPAPGPPPAN